MKNNSVKINCLLLLFIFIFSNVVISQWIQTDGPYGQINIRSVIHSDTLCFISTQSGTFISKNVDERWSKAFNQQFNDGIFKGDSLFLATPEGVMVTDMNDPDYHVYPFDLSLNILAIASQNNDLFAGTEYGGFFKWDSGQNTWIQYNSGLPVDTIWTPWGTFYQRFVFAIGILNDFIFAGTNEGIYRADINGLTWSAFNSGLPMQLVTFIRVIDDKVYAGIQDIVYYSSDNGVSWQVFYTGGATVTSIIKQDVIFYISTNGQGIWYSTDNGSSWNGLNQGLTTFSVNCISAFNENLIAGTQVDGIFSFINNSWITKNKGIICSSIRSVISLNNSIVACDNDDVFLSDNCGGSWDVISPPVDREYFGSLDSMEDTLFLSYTFYVPNPNFENNQRILYSADHGGTWHETSLLPYWGDDTYRMYVDQHKLYAWEDERMFYSTDRGYSWYDISLPEEYCNMFYGFTTFNSIPIASACGYAELIKLNANNQWILSNAGLPSDREVDFLARTENVIFAYVMAEGIYMSADEGITWQPANNDLDCEYLRSFTYYGPHLFVSTNNGVFFTSDNGSSWHEINEGLWDTWETNDITIMNDTLYLSTYGDGIWKRPISDVPLSVTDMKSNGGIRVYPNPSHARFTVDGIQHTGKYQSIVTDLAGRNIYETSGASVPFNLDLHYINSGIYFLTLDDGMEHYVFKLILDKE